MRRLLHAALRLLPLLAVTGVFMAARGVRPEPLQACVWSWEDWFMPFPPCPYDDKPTHDRVRQENRRIAAKLTVVASKLQFVESEVLAWQKTYTTVTRLDDVMEQTYQGLIRNPLPSLVSAYNRTPMGSYMRLRYEGGLNFNAKLIDVRATADSMMDAFRDTTSFRRFYRSWARSGRSLKRRLERDEGRMERELMGLADYRRYSKQIGDSLERYGQRHANRYTEVNDAGGVSEVKISDLAATLQVLRGTEFEMMGNEIDLRLKTLRGASEQRRRAERSRMESLAAHY